MPYNILLITADHMRPDAIAAHAADSPAWGLAHVIQTPNLDRLARGGASFLNAYSPNPICVPARACITTGNYSHTCTGAKDMSGRIRDDQPKLAELYNAAGYSTYAIGKLHYVPYSPPGKPRLLHGFEYCELNEEGRAISEFDPHGELEGVEDYHDYLKSAGWSGYERAHAIGNNDVHPAPSPLPAELHEEAWVANRTIAALERHAREKAGKPFLMWASFTKPHSPYDPPRPYDAMYDPRAIPEPLGGWVNGDKLLEGRDIELCRRPRQYGWNFLSPEAVQTARAYYAGMVSFQDAMIGRMLDWLERSGQAQNTIVIYSCDHGDLLGDFGRFYKSCMFDGSVKVPFIWRVPGIGGGDWRRTQLAGLQDILPTLCSLTGVKLPKVQGRDLAPILRNATAPGADVIYSQTGGPGVQKAMVRTPQWKYVYCEIGPTEELYDMRRPEGDMVNLAGESEHQATLKEMRRRLIDWATETADTKLCNGGQLAVRDPKELPEPAFRAGAMGWRWY